MKKLKQSKNKVIVLDEKLIEESRKTFEPIIKSMQETISAFSKNYASVIQQFVNSIQQGVIIAESLRPQIDIWQKCASFVNYWVDFQRKYNIAEQEAVPVLQKYKWFTTPSIPITVVFEVMKLNKKQGRQYKAINKLFVSYFEAENWKNLEAMVNDWKNKPLLKKRYKILADCVKTIKFASKKRINVANIILPTLIIQIDGVYTDCLISKGIPWGCDYDDWIDNKTGKVKTVGRKTQFKNVMPEILTMPLDKLIK